MKFCSNCGAAIGREWVPAEGRERYVCAACGVTHYENPRVIVLCTVCVGDKILMCRRAQEPAMGQWSVPLGYLECGETLQEGAAREVFEETGVVVDANRLELHSVISMPGIRQITIGFFTELAEEPGIRVGAECLEVAFRPAQAIPRHQLAWQGTLGDVLERFFSDLPRRDHVIWLINLGSEHGVGSQTREYAVTPQRREP